MKAFDDDFFYKLDREEIATIFYEARQQAEMILHSDVCTNLSTEDAKIMATSFSMAISLLRRYNNINSD